MKRYIKSAAKNTTTTKFVFELEYILEEYRIAANFNMDTDKDILDKEINLSILDEYEDFVNRVLTYIINSGFTELDSHKSNRKNSSSYYIEFCREDEYEEHRIACVFYLRISDHRLPNKTGTATNKKNKKDNRHDRRSAEEAFHAQNAQEYKFFNDTDDTIDFANISIIVNGNKFKTYGEAMEYTKVRIKKATKK